MDDLTVYIYISFRRIVATGLLHDRDLIYYHLIFVGGGQVDQIDRRVRFHHSIQPQLLFTFKLLKDLILDWRVIDSLRGPSDLKIFITNQYMPRPGLQCFECTTHSQQAPNIIYLITAGKLLKSQNILRMRTSKPPNLISFST